MHGHLGLLEDLRFQGCRKQHFELRAAETIRRDARRDFATFYYVRRGRIWVEVDRHVPVPVDEGCILVLNRWYAHTIRMTERAEDSHLCAPIRAIEGGVNEAAPGDGGAIVFSSEASTLDSPFKGMLPYIVLISRETIAKTPRFQSILDIYQQFTETDQLQAMIDRRLDEMMAIYLLACGMRELAPVPSYNARLDDDRIKQVLLEMHQHPEARWSVSDLSERAHLSRSGFIDRFKAVIGATPMNYLARLRVERAADMLLKEAVPISSISYRVGYHSEAAFHRAFKKIYHASPGDYRRRARADVQQTG
ncbi:helix-turn-helix domain-containing protein [Sphingomonas canadensis]|uniref:Helix-turn-helix domain-containing protein n=1 Tax=Sphingomonas canadensis TaxID=1219257 RepID=A0ABW3H3W6_9SPHN|nr:AraC family transcriptional regulator [Sphingomonas canadensis]MCW3834720.1 AraC family transcriptional regulator [Sphingomonas canadensis]